MDGNGLELACDRDAAYWRPIYEAMTKSPEAMRSLNKPLDFDDLMRQLETVPA